MITTTIAGLADHVGLELGASPWHTVDQAQIDGFAQATGDNQWVHIDTERAGRELGGTIAHGLLTLSLIPVLSAQVLALTDIGRGANYGFDRTRFTAMVKVGSRIRLRQTLLALEPKGAGTLVRTACVIELEGADRPACVTEFMVLVYPRDA